MRSFISILSFSLTLIAPTILGARADDASHVAPFSHHQWGAVTLFHGLPSNQVRAIAQDADGAMWFGTDSGLVKYDGQRIQKVVTDGPAAGRVRVLKFDSGGTLWVGTDSGAGRLVNGQFTPIAETAGKSITAIITPGGGRVVMTCEQGIVFDCRASQDGAFAVRAFGPEEHSLLSIDANGRNPLHLTSLALLNNMLLIGTRSRGLLAIEGDTVKEILSRPRAFFVEAIAVDAQGRAWYGAQATSEDSGLYFSGDLSRPEKIGAGTGTVKALAFDGRGGLWVGTEGQGAFYRRDAGTRRHFTFENTAGGLRSNFIHAIYVDREGVVWFGTDKGVCRYDPQSPSQETVSADPESNFVRVLYQSQDGILWCGSNRGLFTRDGRGWHPVEAFKGKVIHAIAEDARGRLLVGTAGGLYAVERPGRPPVRIEPAADGLAGDSIRAISNFQGATYAASYGRGVERIEGARRVPIWPGQTSDEQERQVVSLYADQSGRLWIGTAAAGVFAFDGKQVIKLAALEELAGCAVWAIRGTNERALWFATSRGLYWYDGQTLQLLEGDDARALADTGNQANSVWCAMSGGGLLRAFVDERAGVVLARLNAEQGLPSQNTFALLPVKTPEGEELWIGSNRGVARYEPGVAAPHLKAARVMGRRFYQPEEVSAGLELEYPQNSLALDVVATSSRTFPQQFQYAFSLFDGRGNVVRQKLGRDPQLLMEGLRPGRYRVMAIAYTNDLVASEPLTFEFRVAGAPFPWTTAALSLLLLLALAALWWGARQNVRLARMNAALAGANRQISQTRLQLANETETERRRIARDLHDQTLADLRRLMMLTDQLPAGRNGNERIEPAAFRREIESVSTEIRRICEDLSPSVLANVGLIAALEWALADAVTHLPVGKKFDYEFISGEGIEEKLRLSPGEQIQVYRIVQEAIHNICRHAAATHVRLAVEVDATGAFLLRLEDDGRGFDRAISAGGMGRGLTNIRTRAHLIDAEAAWKPRPGGGTVFTLSKAGSPGANPKI
ncbi:MAG TPA: two-component regulator propeller domain-containing protein [Blastocatellia bacterium]|nr:two-component regulator propeller domain-containing protein [Blastocatellia bacterium]